MTCMMLLGESDHQRAARGTACWESTRASLRGNGDRMDYLEWNDLIANRFFNPDKGGMRVFLYVTRNVIEEVGAPHGVGLADFVEAVKAGPPWNTRHGRGICQQALQALDNWRGRHLALPPHIGYLALFVLADTVDVGYARFSYYPGLHSLLGEDPAAGTYPSFNQMHSLWDDRAIWSNHDKEGEWGIFDADIVGEWMHVGLPRAQTLLTEKERGQLPILFAENGFDPNSPPSERELTYLLAHDRHHCLRPHMIDLLLTATGTDSPVRDALIEAILDELENWDGTAPARFTTTGSVRDLLGSLRLGMMLDRTGHATSFVLRCRSRSEYPQEGLRLVEQETENELYCQGDWQGWSTPLSTAESEVFDAAQLDWLHNVCLIDSEHSWIATLPKRAIRIFASGASFGFDGYVEESQIPQGTHFHLVAHDSTAEILQEWGARCCKGFCEVDVISGIPPGWQLFSVDRADCDDLVRDVFPSLALPETIRIRLRGGLKLKGNQYFPFALPSIQVTGDTKASTVHCNHTKLDIDPKTGTYSIPSCLRSRRLVVEVMRDGKCIRKRSLYVVATTSWRDISANVRIDRHGVRSDSEALESCVGPILFGAASPEFDPQAFLPPSVGHRIYFIGRNPGEIVECPRENLADDWSPVWAIPMRKRGKGVAVYCGSNPNEEEPGTLSCADRRKLRCWKEVLWSKRKRIASPTHPSLRALWRRYREVAQHVC